MTTLPTCPDCGEPLRNGFDALIHAFEHGAEGRDTISPLAQALADNVKQGGT